MAFNVLIVDDSSSMRAVIKKTIRVSGFNVGQYLEASNGAEALEVLSREWVDLVLTDINMPRMDGLELVREMKNDELFRSIPVVMVTTEGSETRVKESMELGARGYIKKPFKPQQIKAMLGDIMGEGEYESGYYEKDEGCDF
ncbi:MAG: response regulator [Deltaproteobacteria bacterium]|nr:MAG: response regulator [Deltaproteobacteria bacterium]